MVDSNYSIKIADFGFSAPVKSQNGDKFLTKILGTRGYMAPELHLALPYKGEEVDLYAASIVLFNFVTGHPPFLTATKKDELYRTLYKELYHIFWQAHFNFAPTVVYSNDFKDLMEKMFSLDPRKRLNIQ